MKDVCFTCGSLFSDINCSIVVLVHKTCVELLQAGKSLVKALLAPKQRASEPSKVTLEAFAVLNARFITGIYELLIYKLKGPDADAPAGSTPSCLCVHGCFLVHPLGILMIVEIWILLLYSSLPRNSAHIRSL